MKKSMLGFFFTLLFFSSLEAIEVEKLQQILAAPFPFSYPLNVQIIGGKGSEVLLFFHGSGSNNKLANVIDSYHVVDDHLVSFNFPDYDCYQRQLPQSKITQGTLQQLLPPLCILKRLIVDGGLEKISLYGFSSGAASVVNTIAVLNSNEHDRILADFGIRESDKIAILNAIQKGVVLLDAPLKSEKEIQEVKGNNTFYAQRYQSNQMEPLFNLSKWEGLKLFVIVFFQNPDHSVCNRDDWLFANTLQVYNQGRNIIISGDEGGAFGLPWVHLESISQKFMKNSSLVF